ncbi:hypothetical protein BOFL111202_17730 [Bordetella flabilis]
MNVPPVDPATLTPPVVMGRSPTETMASASFSGSVSLVRMLPLTSDFSLVVFWSLPAVGPPLSGVVLASPAGVNRLMAGTPAPGYSSASGVVPSTIRARRTKLLPPASPPPATRAAVGSRLSKGSWPLCSAASRRSESVPVGGATAASERSTGWPAMSALKATSRFSPIVKGIPPSVCRPTVPPEAVTISVSGGMRLPTCSSVSEPSLLRIQARPVTCVTTAGVEKAML